MSYLLESCGSAVHSSDSVHPFLGNFCPLSLPPSDGCDGGLRVIRGESRVVSSPGYPLPYRNNLNCLYEIDVSGKSTIETILAEHFYNDH